MLAAFFNLVAIIIEAATTMYLLEALFPLGNAGYLKAFTPEQLYAMATLSLKSHGYGFGVSLLFFACFCLIVGYLIFKSGYLPKTIGVLMQIAGVCYLTNSFALILSPAVANRLFPAILVPAFIGEASLCLWLLVRGVKVEKWRKQALDMSVSVTGCDYLEETKRTLETPTVPDSSIVPDELSQLAHEVAIIAFEMKLSNGDIFPRYSTYPRFTAHRV